MKNRIWTIIEKNLLAFFFAVIFLVGNHYLVKWDFINRYPLFVPNDYARTILQYETDTFGHIIYGNSGAIAGIRDDQLDGVANASIAYGTITDLEKMLKQKYIIVEDKITICANYMMFMDTMNTDPYYPWHRRFYEPYIFFYRQQVYDYVEKNLTAFFDGEEAFAYKEGDYNIEKYRASGRLSVEELQKKILEFDERYGELTILDMQNNIDAFDCLIQYADMNGIELSFIWMPINPVYTTQPFASQIRDIVNDKLETSGIPFADWTYGCSPEYFYDLGHLNREQGSHYFTEELIVWLSKYL